MEGSTARPTDFAGKINHWLDLPEFRFVRDELSIMQVIIALKLERCGRQLVRCPNDASHFAKIWVRKNRVHCFECPCNVKRTWSTIDLIMEVLDLPTAKEAVDWVCTWAKVPTCGKITGTQNGKNKATWLDTSPHAREKRLVPDIRTAQKARKWGELSHCARLMVMAILILFQGANTLVITTSQEKLRTAAGIGNRHYAKKALEAIQDIGMIECQRTASNRETKTGKYTTDLTLRLTWSSPLFQEWLVCAPIDLVNH